MTSPRATPQPLSGLDALFLHIETAEMPMHVGALHLLELPAGHEGRFVDDLRRHVRQRLALAPSLRRRLWEMPLRLANPCWLEAEPDLRKHVVEVRLPASARRGSGWEEMEDAVAVLHAQRLDRTRPLWKFHVLEGLAPTPDGRHRVGVYTQLHHAAMDGQAAVALANLLFDPAPGAAAPERPSSSSRARRAPAHGPGAAEMLRIALAHEAREVARIVRGLPGTLGSLGAAATRVLANAGVLPGAGGRVEGRVSNLALAPRTPMNVSITAARVFAGASLPLAELRAMARTQGVTLNDLVLMLCASALRRWLEGRGALPPGPLVAAVPVTLRGQGDDDAGNLATLSLVTLGTHLADPAQRLAWIAGATASMKSTMGALKSVSPVDYPSIGVPWLLEGAASLYGRLEVADRLPPIANVVISNVPGPSRPMYLAGARLVAARPASIVVHGCALNITVQSVDRTMEFGLVADARALPDLRVLAGGLEAAMDELRALPAPAPGARRNARAASGPAVGGRRPRA